MNKYIFIDVETTSLDPRNGNITELGFIYQVDGKIKMKKQFKGTEESIYIAFISYLNLFVDRYNPNDKLYFIGHNANFDSEFIREMFRRNHNEFYGAYFFNPSICTLHMAGNYFMGKRDRPINFKLATLLKYFNIPFNEDKLHSALYDATVMRELFKVLKYKKMNKKNTTTKAVSKNSTKKTTKPVARKSNYTTVEAGIQQSSTGKYRARVSVNGELMQSPFVGSITAARKYRKTYMNMRNA